MKKSLCLDTVFRDAPFEERFAKARDAGFACVELGDWSELDLTRAQELLTANGLELTSISGARNHSLGDPADREDFLEFLSQSVAIAKSFRCSRVVVPCEDGCDNMDSVADALAGAAKKAARAGMTLLFRPGRRGNDHPACLASAGETVRAIHSASLKLLYEARRENAIDAPVANILHRFRDILAYVQIADDGQLQHVRRLLRAELRYDGIVGFRLDSTGREEECIEAIKNF